MSDEKLPRFDNEAEEAEWWAKQQDFISDKFDEARIKQKLGSGTVAKLAQERSGASPTVTIRLPQTDLVRARAQAAERGLRYQTYLKMLLHQALNAEERKQ